MKMISENLGRIIAALAAIALLVCCVTAFRTDVSGFFDNVIGKETAIGDKVLGAMDAFDVSMNGSGGSGETQATPPAPTANLVLDTEIVLNTVEGCEYSMDGATWQDSPEFTGLEPGTEYTLYMRYKATENTNTSEAVSIVIRTALAAGLYETGTTNLLYSWEQLLEDGVVTVENGILTTGSDEDFDENSSADVLSGDLIIDDSVTTIVNSFWGCTNLTSIIIPDSVTSIGNYAFSDCESLTSITIPDSVTSIGNYAFTGCTSLESVSFGENSQLTSIGKRAFEDCSNLTSTTIPDSVTSIGDYAFYCCYNLSSNISIPDGITGINDGTFYGCNSLTSITIPNGVTSIGASAFSFCKSLTSITIPDSVTSIGVNAFHGCNSLTSITIPDSVTSIGAKAFSSCTSLTSITVNSGNATYHSAGNCLIETASKELIAGCKSSVIPTDGSVTSIGIHAFSWCDDLTSITIPDNVTSIGANAFYSCKGLTSITLPDGVTSIGEDAFGNCTALVLVRYAGDETAWNAISIHYSNTRLLNTTILYNTTGE